MYRVESIIWQNGCTFKLNAPELCMIVDCGKDSGLNGGKEDKVVGDRNEEYDMEIIHLLEVSFVDSCAALPRVT